MQVDTVEAVGISREEEKTTMPEKKAVKKAAKKAAKKSPKHHGKGHHEGKDIRRAYEHLGRLEALEGGLPGVVVAQIKVLTELARTSLQRGEDKSAADLLRASEHLAFGALATATKGKVGDELQAAITAEFEHLREKSLDHWEKHEDDRPAGVEAIYEKTLAAAAAAYAKGAYRRALELARGAEALAHVHGAGGVLLEDGGVGIARR